MLPKMDSKTMTNCFLFEIGCEPVPSNLHHTTLQQLKRLLECHRQDLLMFSHAKYYVTSHRIAFVLDNPSVCTSTSPRKGPLVSIGTKAFDGFVRSCNVAREQCYQKDTPKGMTWFAPPPDPPSLEKALVFLCQKILDDLTWPKKIRLWPNQFDKQWIRPIRTLTSLYNDQLLKWTWGPLHTQRHICMHRLWNNNQGLTGSSQCTITLNHARDYEDILCKGMVIPDFQERVRTITQQMNQMALQHGAYIDTKDMHNVIESNAGLVEWPNAIMGSFNPVFLDLPDAVIETTLHDQQRCFSMRDEKKERLLPHFIFIADGPISEKKVKRGYEKVIDARLSDGLFFWKKDLSQTIDHYVERLKDRSFFEQMGSFYDKTNRIKKLVIHMASNFDVSIQTQCAQSAHLCYADLSTNMVKEFPNLQGIMGYHYAKHAGQDSKIAQAIYDRNLFYQKSFVHETQSRPISSLLAIADSLDTLVGFFSMGHAPSGSKDPLALRRASHNLLRAAFSLPFDHCIADFIPYALSLYHEQKILCHTQRVPRLQNFLQERLIYILQKDTSYHHRAIGCASIAQSPRDTINQCTTLDRIMRMHPDFLAAYHRIARVVGQDDHQHLINHQLLQQSVEKEMLDLTKKEISFQNLSQWTHVMNSFMDTILIQEKNYYSARMGLLQHVIKQCASWAPVHLLCKENVD
jgi:glycyl-tRNA synthetase beta chain